MIPKQVNSCVQSNFKPFHRVIPLSLQAPIFATLVFSLFTFKPLTRSNSFRICIQFQILFSVGFKNKVVSSAYKEVLCSCLCIVIPSICLFAPMALAITSAAMNKRYGDTGSPCLHPLPKMIFSEKFPFRSILEV